MPSTAILAVSALYHDAAACLVVDGRVVAAAQEERFSRLKHDHAFPVRAIAYCLDAAGLKPGDLTHFVFYEKPVLKLDRLVDTWIREAPRGLSSFLHGLASLLSGKLSIGAAADDALGGRYSGPVLFARHHHSHAASAFYPSPFDRAAVLTVDGVGEWATTTLMRGVDNRLEPLREIHFPHSLGLLYSAVTDYLGFRVNSGEYKVMGLAPYGTARYADALLADVVSLHDDGSFRLNMRYFPYVRTLRMWHARLASLFGGPPRTPEARLEPRHADVAASIQRVTELALLNLARAARELTGERRLCLAGGVALNCVANGRLLREGPFDDLWIQPAAGDAGAALGAALHLLHDGLGAARVAEPEDAQQGSLLGPSFEDAAVWEALDGAGARYEVLPDLDAACTQTAEALARGEVVGWFQGRMEYGPRALGNRSILADARDPAMQSRVNIKVKQRESFRPFAPVVLAERVAEYFDLDRPSPYMLLVAPVARAQRMDPEVEPAADATDIMARLRARRSRIPAVTHVDGSARIQTVDDRRNPTLARLLRAFERLTGDAVLLNTSFNIRGEPIVCTPHDAYRCFMSTALDRLVIGRTVLVRSKQPASPFPRLEPRPD